jgi:hypothetical protein
LLFSLFVSSLFSMLSLYFPVKLSSKIIKENGLIGLL